MMGGDGIEPCRNLRRLTYPGNGIEIKRPFYDFGFCRDIHFLYLSKIIDNFLMVVKSFYF